MQVTRQGDLIYDHGRAQRIHAVEFEAGRAEVRDGSSNFWFQAEAQGSEAKAGRQVVCLSGRSGQPGLPVGF